MVNHALVEHELAAAETARKDGNDGKARVCVRRAVALVTEAWLAGLPHPLWRGDAMEHLRQIERHASFPLAIRQAAERLSTAVPHRHVAPFTIDPLADARVIIEYLAANSKQ
jgi:hypothetical protein